jgi:hypothetical protein
MDTARTTATAVWCLSLASVCVVSGLLDPAAATLTVAVAVVAVVTADATTSLG